MPWECPSDEELRESAAKSVFDRIDVLKIPCNLEDRKKITNFFEKTEMTEKPESEAHYDEILARSENMDKDEINGLFSMAGISIQGEGSGEPNVFLQMAEMIKEAAAADVTAAEAEEEGGSDNGSAFDEDAESGDSDESWECPDDETLKEQACAAFVARATHFNIDLTEENIAALRGFFNTAEAQRPKSKKEYQAVFNEARKTPKEGVIGMLKMLNIGSASGLVDGMGSLVEALGAVDGNSDSNSDSDSDSESDSNKGGDKIEAPEQEEVLKMMEEWFLAHLASMEPPVVLSETQLKTLRELDGEHMLGEDAEDAYFSMTMVDRLTEQKRDKILLKAQAEVMDTLEEPLSNNAAMLTEMLADPVAYFEKEGGGG